MSSERRQDSSESGARDAPLARGLFVFALACCWERVGSLLRSPDLGAAVIFPPYAMLTAALVISPRHRWLSYILVGSAAHFVTHWPDWSLS